MIGAVGVVYGDIGTSPLYALKQVFTGENGVRLTPENLIGVVSVILWSLMLVVSVKYVSLILRADNRGEGGVMAMMALASGAVRRYPKLRAGVVLLGLLGTALFYGDGVITPAISVLSAVEGLEIAAPGLKSSVVPITIVILVGLYAAQRRGTASIGAVFGPIMLIWFGGIGILGLLDIRNAPSILLAINPLRALEFLVEHPQISFIALGSIVLALTGAEALYADLGHFGKRAIRSAWFVVVFPALGLSYLGQGALILADEKAISNPFYLQVGPTLIYPMVALATVATVIASQATISGLYSITKQAIQLGYLPRMRIDHTSSSHIGQIYIPVVNWIQFALVIAAVLGFGSSDNLASAYGVAVTGTMLITTVMTFFVLRFAWHYKVALAVAATGVFALVDLAFFSATLLKVVEGGWFPLLLGGLMFALMTTWKQGRAIVWARVRDEAIPLNSFLASLFESPPTRVPGTAVFLRGTSEGVPRALLHNLSHNKILHERVFFLTVHSEEIPYVAPQDRNKITPLLHHCFQIDVHYGFKDELDLPKALEEACETLHEPYRPLETSFFMSRQTVIPTVGNGGMANWREKLFAMVSRNAGDAADYYKLPTNRVIELGAQVEI
jgi:KUP system potassium uptake protein